MVEIIPKQFTKPLFSPPFFLFVSVLLFLGMLFGLFLIKQTQSANREVLKSLEERLHEEQTLQEETFQTEVESSKKKIEDFRFLMKLRKDFLPYFQFLEETTHPQVVFTDFDGSVDENTIKLSGIVTDFRSLEQQRLIWKTRKEITGIVFSELVLEKTGEKSFDVALSFVPEFAPHSLSTEKISQEQ